MSPGKLAAQAGHAYLNAYLRSPNPLYQAPNGEFDPIGTKICLETSNIESLLDIKSELIRLSISHSLIIDSGHVLLPHFTGEPVPTALGFGPIERDKVFHITNKLKLVN